MQLLTKQNSIMGRFSGSVMLLLLTLVFSGCAKFPVCWGKSVCQWQPQPQVIQCPKHPAPPPELMTPLRWQPASASAMPCRIVTSA